MSSAANSKQARRNLVILTVAQVLRLPNMTWAIRNVVPMKGFVIVFGPSGSGKSFLVLDMIAKLLSGTPWFGNPVARNLACLFFVLEGWGGISKRVKAWQIFYGQEYPKQVRFTHGPFSITDVEEVKRVAAEIKANGRLDVIVIDTLNRAAPGADENRSDEMGRIIANADLLQRLTGALVLLVHHTGKDESRGPRGHSSLLAAADAILAVRNKDGERYWELIKSKDGAAGVSRKFDLVPVEVGIDEFELPMTSAAIRETEEEASSAKKEVALGKNQTAVLAEFRTLIVSKELLEPRDLESTDPVGIACDEVITRCKQCVDVSDNRHRTERVKEAIKSLVKTGHIVERDGMLYLPT